MVGKIVDGLLDSDIEFGRPQQASLLVTSTAVTTRAALVPHVTRMDAIDALWVMDHTNLDGAAIEPGQQGMARQVGRVLDRLVHGYQLTSGNVAVKPRFDI